MIIKKRIRNVLEFKIEKNISFKNNIYVIDKNVFKLFNPKRTFLIKDDKTIRGNHAHKKLHQFLICVNGKIIVNLDFGRFKKKITLTPFCNGLYIPPKVWSSQEYLLKNSVLLVISNDYYKEADYIRDYANYLKLCND